MVTRSEWSETVNSFIYNKFKPGNDKFWDPKIETMPRKDLQELRDKKFRTVVSYLYDNSPYYKRKFDSLKLKPGDFRTTKDVAKGPVTVKEDFAISEQEHPPFGDFECITMDEWSRDGFMIESTGGTTAKPRIFMVSGMDKDTWTYIYARTFWAYGIRPGDILFNATVYGPFPGMWGSHYGAHLLKTPIIPGGGMDSKRRLFFIKECRATVLIGVPSYVMHLAEEAKALGIDLVNDTEIKHVVMMAEPGACIPSIKKKIESAWGGTTHDYFGHTEAFMGGALGHSCIEEDSQIERPVADHIAEDMGLVEVVDPNTYEPVGNGERGMTIVTNMFSVSYPAFRYVMGDLIEYTDEKCACGRTFGRAVGGLLGRVDDMLKIRGTVVYPSAVESVIRSFKDFGAEYEITLSRTGELDEISVKVEVDSSVPRDKWKELREKLGQELSFALGIRSDVQLVQTNTLPHFTRGDLDAKARRVKDLRPKLH
jgi:phenylacetate-CoA ligase